MVRIFITGSSDGLGLLSARALVERGHSVVLHARNETRAKDAKSACPGAEACVVADLSDVTQTRQLAADINKLGSFDTVIYNAGLYTGPYRRTKEGWPAVFAVNTVATYILTCSIKPRPRRIVYISSGLHNGGDTSCEDLTWSRRGEEGFNDSQAYADTKLHAILLSYAFARRWPQVLCNSLDPGWVATRMGGPNASGDINAAIETYTMLAEGIGDAKEVTGSYWYLKNISKPKNEVNDATIQDKLLGELEALCGISAEE